MLPERSSTSMTSVGLPATPVVAWSVRVTVVDPSQEMSVLLTVLLALTVPAAAAAGAAPAARRPVRSTPVAASHRLS